jgi:hypothetical protein
MLCASDYTHAKSLEIDCKAVWRVERIIQTTKQILCTLVHSCAPEYMLWVCHNFLPPWYLLILIGPIVFNLNSLHICSIWSPYSSLAVLVIPHLHTLCPDFSCQKRHSELPPKTHFPSNVNTPPFLTNIQGSRPTSNVAMYLFPKTQMILDQCDPQVGMQAVNLPSPIEHMNNFTVSSQFPYQTRPPYRSQIMCRILPILSLHGPSIPKLDQLWFMLCQCQVFHTYILAMSTTSVPHEYNFQLTSILNLSYAYNCSIFVLFSL